MAPGGDPEEHCTFGVSNYFITLLLRGIVSGGSDAALRTVWGPCDRWRLARQRRLKAVHT